eukprot:g77491.t1
MIGLPKPLSRTNRRRQHGIYQNSSFEEALGESSQTKSTDPSMDSSAYRKYHPLQRKASPLAPNKVGSVKSDSKAEAWLRL